MAKVERTCNNCGEEFMVEHRDVLRGYGHFCSRSCSGTVGGVVKAAVVDQTGPENPNWKGGISKDNYHYKKLRKLRHPERVKASEIVSDAIRGGKLVRGKCKICNSSDAQAHHEDYSKPLEVIWFCRDHHQTWHRLSNEMA